MVLTTVVFPFLVANLHWILPNLIVAAFLRFRNREGVNKKSIFCGHVRKVLSTPPCTAKLALGGHRFPRELRTCSQLFFLTPSLSYYTKEKKVPTLRKVGLTLLSVKKFSKIWFLSFSIEGNITEILVISNYKFL